MKRNVLVKCLFALGIACAIVLLAHHVENDFKAKMKAIAKTQRLKNKQKAKEEKKRPAFDYDVDWDKLNATIHWRLPKKASRGASKYHIVCYRVKNEYPKDLETIGEQDISAEEKLTYAHPIVYGAKYEYEIRIYRIVAGKECWATTRDYKLEVSLPDLWNNWWSSTVELSKTIDHTNLFFRNYYRRTPPMGIEIYRGETQQQMELVDTVMWDELSVSDGYKVYTDKRQSYADYYQVRSFIDIAGTRKYGKKSEIRLFLAEGYQGEVDAEIKASQKQKINKIEVVMTNKSKLPFHMKRKWKYNKKYYENETEPAMKPSSFYLYKCGGFDGCYGSADRWGIDEISYKFHSSDEYQILSEEDTVPINPQETIYIRFARKDHKKFENPLYEFSEEEIHSRAVDMSIFLFQYMGKSCFLDINIDHPLYTRMGWGIVDEMDEEIETELDD